MVSKTSEVYLGIDPGIADTGFGLVRKEGPKMICLAYGSIKTAATKPLDERLLELHGSLREIIERFKPDMVGIEELFFAKNAKTALVVGQARGVALLTIKQYGLPMMEFTPLQVKQAVSTYGRADKGQVQRMVKMLLNLKVIPKPDDAADALAIAICAANSIKLK
jgi:crossover junction endodeoxyribonuclease RuvC